MAQNFEDNTLYEMDNLVVLRGMNRETVDLIATDPPFNTKRNRSGSAGHYVDNWKWGDTDDTSNNDKLPDQWEWNVVHPKWLEEIKDNHIELYHAIEAAIHCQGEDTAAFLCFLSVRLLEMHRVLKPTGSIYLHCDPTASHYIKACMDAIFGKKNFRNEIIWHYQAGTGPRTAFKRKHDVIYFYTKSSQSTFNRQSKPVVNPARYNRIDEEGRAYDVNGQGRRYYLDEGQTCDDVWTYIQESEFQQLNSQSNERTGSPDQKPLALYKRFIEASSVEDDLVLDPFCGCATTIVAADELKRRWIGIDRRVDARYHIITRLMGTTRQERKHLEQYALDKDWLNRQMQRYEMCYQTEPPKRTDKDEQAVPELPQVYSVAEPENPLTHAEMKKILVERFELKCWGCNYIPPDERYLHLDHIIPKSDGGTNHIDNRALLCQPCNSMKSNTMSLSALQSRNRREGYEHDNEPIDLQSALAWTKQYMFDLMQRSAYQYEMDFEG